MRVVDQFSFKDDSRLYCPLIELMKLEDKTKGHQWMMEHQSPSSIVKIKEVLYVLSSEAAMKTPKPDLPALAKDFIKKQKKFDYDSFQDWANMKNTIYELKKDEEHGIYRCSCVYGQKWIFCKHAVGCMIKFLGFAIPDTAKSVPLHEHRKRGRPVKNKGWWSRE